MSSWETRPNKPLAESGEVRPLKSQQGVYNRTEERLERAIRDETDVLFTAPMGSGKTESTFKIASRIDTPITYVAGRTELYDQGEELAEKYGVDATVVPSPYRDDCPAFKKGSEADRLYEHGVRAKEIHSELDLHNGSNCRYMRFWNDFDPDDHEMLIANPKHLYIPPLRRNRLIVGDEFPGDSFEPELSNPHRLVTPYLRQTDEIPFDSLRELLENRDDPEKRRRAELSILDDGIDVNTWEIVNSEKDDRYHRLAPLIAYSLLDPDQFDNGFEAPAFNYDAVEGTEVLFGDQDHRVAFNRCEDRWGERRDEINVLTVPDLSNARGVVGLDGTGTKALWVLSMGLDFEERGIFDDKSEERRYYHDIQGTTVKQTRQYLKAFHTKPYPKNRDRRVLEGIEEQEGEDPGIISTDSALDAYDGEILDRGDHTLNFGKVPSSNDLEEIETGAVLGSPCPSNDVLKKWAAYSGREIEQEGEGADKTFGKYGDQIYEHYVHDQVFQAILRFGRKPHIEPTVYVETSAIPDILDVEEVEIASSATGRILNFIRESGDEGISKSEISDESGLEESTVDYHLDKIKEASVGAIEEEQQADWPYRKVYRWCP